MDALEVIRDDDELASGDRDTNPGGMWSPSEILLATESIREAFLLEVVEDLRRRAQNLDELLGGGSTSAYMLRSIAEQYEKEGFRSSEVRG